MFKDQDQVLLDASLLFLVKPTINNATYFPKIYHEINSEQLYSCSATGVPTPTVTWYQGSIDTKNAKGTGTGKAEMTIKPGKNGSSQYTCIAENEAGGVRKKMTLLVACKYTSFITVSSLFPNWQNFNVNISSKLELKWQLDLCAESVIVIGITLASFLT